MVSFISASTTFILIWLFLAEVLGITPNITQCPEFCRCDIKEAYVICQGTEDYQVNYIPKLPQMTRELVFTGNSLPHVFRDTFQNITFQNGARIEKLDLSNNGILTISAVAFNKLTYLKELDLSKNYLRDPDGLQKALVGLRYIHIHNLTLRQMQIGDDSVPINLFEPFTYLKTIQHIDMSDNILNEFDFQTLANLTALEKFTISRNRITAFTLGSEQLPGVKHLDLHSNNALVMPYFCVSGLSIFPDLIHLELDDNFITYLDVEDFNCLTHLKILSLNANPVTLIPTNLIEEMTSLEDLRMTSMLRIPVEIAPGAFTSNSLRHLRLAGNEFTSNIFTVHGFNGLNNIKTLDLSGSEFQTLPSYPENLLGSFVPDSVETLLLNKCILDSVPRFNSSTLRELDLSGNNIKVLNPRDLSGYPSLITLNLNSNRLTKISPEVIPRKMQDQLMAVGLADNPLLCSCEIAWLREWLDRDPIKFLTLGPQAACISQETGQFILLEKYEPIGCGGGDNHRTLTIISIVCSLVVIIITVILLYCYRKRIKLCCYICTRRRGGEELVRNEGTGI